MTNQPHDEEAFQVWLAWAEDAAEAYGAAGDAELPDGLTNALRKAETNEHAAYRSWDAIAAESILTRDAGEEERAYRFWEDAITATNAARDAVTRFKALLTV